MISRIELIPTTPLSHPFVRAALSCGFEQKGYVEEEYFLHGTSNIYEETAQGDVRVLFADAPYINRMVVRRPAEPDLFSGNVVLEVLNPSARVDIDRIWVETWPHLMRRGDIYIGLTSKADVLDALYQVDSQRYAPLSWANPLPGRPLPKPGAFPVLPQYENGLLWDMLSDLATLFKQGGEPSPLCGFTKSWLYLAGWSQCGGFLTRYRETFANRAGEALGEPVFDGYFHAGAGSARAPINSFSDSEPFFETRPNFPGYIASSEPFMVINTETETPHTRWGGDMDLPYAKFRVYEFAGSSHDSKYNLIDYYADDDDLDKIGRRQPYYGLELHPLDYPYEYLFAAAFHNLCVWVREGVPPPPSLKVDRLADGESRKDAFGNTSGGVRSPFIDLPTCLYSKYCTLKDEPGKTRDFWGHVVPFEPPVLKALYSSLDNYRNLVAQRTDEIICRGYLLAADREHIIRDAVNFARKRGLT